MRFFNRPAALSVLLACLICASGVRSDDSAVKHPLTERDQSVIKTQQQHLLNRLADAPESVSVHSQRGDALFFLGRFQEAAAEYESMVKLNRALDSSHWRLGIAYFFADQADDGALQFEKYSSFDDVDRENGIWRYLCQYKSKGAETARNELLRYEKDDREPFPAVYRMFDGSMSADKAIEAISDDLTTTEREKRLFYTELYIGMHCVVRNEKAKAKAFLHRAVTRKWPRDNGFGPNYMWHVARVQYNQLVQEANDPQRSVK